MRTDGKKSWRILLDDPEILQIALYIRDIAGLCTPGPVSLPGLSVPAGMQPAVFPPDMLLPAVALPAMEPALPPLEPSVRVWPSWVRRPSGHPAPLPAGFDIGAARVQWQRWWNHALMHPDIARRAVAAPRHSAFNAYPELRWLLRTHYEDAAAWTKARHEDPRYVQNMSVPWSALTELVREIEDEKKRAANGFELHITIVPVNIRHAWVLGPGHLLISRQLMIDLDNLTDWIRPRLRVMV
ncbi:hypothetical protein EH165_15070 [Nakamurella antarctica]|uniref:Uncharacterized protein n=1 Tax=Nakamurella antarctica TaxID=1902245 RepID=A0A3G8ZPJ5_9ACTN|nr:hypothetical protein [Nakamurella antarctica]AZI59262.1 hypothetical protein EH165_15070 [Nakamurella antarctica]